LKSVTQILTAYFLHSRWLRIYVYSLVVKSRFVAEVGFNDLYSVSCPCFPAHRRYTVYSDWQRGRWIISTKIRYV